MEKIGTLCSKNKEKIGIIATATILYHFCQLLISTIRKNKHPSAIRKGKKIKGLSDHLLRKIVEGLVPEEIIEADNPLIEEVKYLCGETTRIQKVPHLIESLEMHDIEKIVSPFCENLQKVGSGKIGKASLPKQSFIYKGSYVLSKNIYASSQQLSSPTEWLLAGPRRCLFFKPSEVKVAIVTCGGLCPGLNVVIREIYINLNLHYGCPEVYGVHYGYQGLYSDNWQLLTVNDIRSLQFQGGTFLGSSRGGFNLDRIIDSLEAHGINQLYVIGGDGTHRGISALYEQIKARRLKISIIGVPKTIDNDIAIIDKSFGFETSVAESIRAIRSAYVESIGAQYGIGLVTLMGRDAGFIAMEATNASRDVDLCLIPEASFDLYGKKGILQYVLSCLMERKHLVIVVAEGAAQGARDLTEQRESLKKDKSGNVKPPDIGEILKKQIIGFCQQKNQIEVTLKYINPAYMIRTVPANSYDVSMCSHLAASAVHGAMAGFSGFTVGHVNNIIAMIPVSQICKRKNRVDLQSRAWQRVLAGTGQPSLRN